MFQRILVGIAGTPTAEAAAHFAIRLAAQQSGALRLVYVVDNELVALISRVMQRAQEEVLSEVTGNGQQALGHTVRLAAQQGVAADTKLRRGIPAIELVAEARDWPADLIVLGSTMRHGPRRMTVGRVIDPVIENTDCPVLVVRHEGSVPPPSRV